MTAPNKALGQHWLKDRDVLSAIAAEVELTPSDTVLEIGPGLGTLTSILLAEAGQVVAVEFDEQLANKLPGQFPGKNLTVTHADILSYDLSQLPSGYKVVANVPYYITSKIIKHLMTSDNKPSFTALLIQKEVAQRLAAEPGEMSLLALSAQIFAEVSLGVLAPAELFTPPPKVDSQVVVLRTRKQPLVDPDLQREFFRVAKAGFAGKRKKLRSSLAAGLAMEKSSVEEYLVKSAIDPNLRAEDLSIEDWLKLTKVLYNK